MDITALLGRLHPMVVHLPIGFLIIAAAFDVISYARKYRHMQHAVAPALLAGFASAVVACIFGYWLSLSGSYDDDLLANHKISGILLAITSGLWWILAARFFTDKFFLDRRIETTFGLGVIALLGYAGHQGGSLTHGSDYLVVSERKPKRELPSSPAEARVFDDVVLPVLERKCEGCHRRGKRKGDLILSSYGDVMRGGENGMVVTAGNLDKSELYRRITLDPDHKDFMPTDGKKPLTKEETDIIAWWIEKAQASNEAKVADIEGHADMLAIVSAIIGLEDHGLGDIALVNTRPLNPDIPMSADMGAIDNLRKKGMMVRVMLHAPLMLDITLPAGTTGLKEFEHDLQAVAANVVWLNLSGNNLAASDLIALKAMRNLEKLRLERNPLGDDVFEILKDLNHLEALNINDTKVSDDGYSKLKELPSLKRIYRWSSKVATQKN